MLVRRVALTRLVVDGLFFAVFGTVLRRVLQAGGSSRLCVMLVTHHSRDLEVGDAGSLSGEMRRAQAGEASSMGLALTSWVTLVSPSSREAVIFAISPSSESTGALQQRQD